MIEITINNQKIQAQAGERLIDVADREKINIPRFCYHKKLSVAANCRMCLVQVEGAPKLMPACATYVNEGMKVSSVGEAVKKAQQSVMEFLLINHPLDCPVCDQGGECELQDVSLEFGCASSRFTEQKRSFINPDIGPLISTELNRCIQCSRCVRFGQEISGVMELGLVGRGMHSSINTFLDCSMDSEISGNVIDLCPVGALTAKPSRFSARSWEMSQKPFVALSDMVGSNANAHLRNGTFHRVTPRENDSVNETWLSDIDRFGYEGNLVSRYSQPMVKKDDIWHTVSWQDALQFTAEKLTDIKEDLQMLVQGNQGAEASFMVNHFLDSLAIQKPTRGFTQHILADLKAEGVEKLSDFSNFQKYVLIGSDLRYSQPLLNLAVRKAVQKGANVLAFEAQKTDFAYSTSDLDNESIVQIKSKPHLFAEELKKAVDEKLIEADQNTLFIIGKDAVFAPNFAELIAYIDTLKEQGSAKRVVLSNSSNAIAHSALSVPSHFSEQTKGYLLVDIEPNEDFFNSFEQTKKIKKAEFVVSLASHKNEKLQELADVILPLATALESGATHVNLLHKIQQFSPVLDPFAGAKPAWKILTALLKFIQIQQGQKGEIQYYELAQLQKSVKKSLKKALKKVLKKDYPKPLKEKLVATSKMDQLKGSVFASYQGSGQTNSSLRRAKSIQKTLWAQKETSIRLNAQTAQNLKLTQGIAEVFYQGELFGSASVKIDDNLADDMGLIPVSIAPMSYGSMSQINISAKDKGNSKQENKAL